MTERRYSLLYRLYRDGRCMIYSDYLSFLFDAKPRTLQALKQDYGETRPIPIEEPGE